MTATYEIELDDDAVICFVGDKDKIQRVLGRLSIDGVKHNIETGESASVIQRALIVRGNVEIDPVGMTVSINKQTVDLTSSEFKMLEFLAKRPGFLRSRNQIIDVVHGEDYYITDRTIDSHIKRIRQKCKAIDSNFDGIQTVWGEGYRYKQH